MNWEEIFTSNNPAGGRMINVISGVAGSEASPYTADNPSGGRAINVNLIGGGSVATGVLQLNGGAPLDTTLRSVTDQANTVSPLQLSTTLVRIQRPTAGDSYLYIKGATSSLENQGVVFTPNSSDVIYGGISGDFSSGVIKVGGFRTGGYYTAIYADNAEIARFRAGNLGVGYSSGDPLARLHVRGDGTNPIARFESGAGLFVGGLSNGGVWSISSDGSVSGTLGGNGASRWYLGQNTYNYALLPSYLSSSTNGFSFSSTTEHGDGIGFVTINRTFSNNNLGSGAGQPYTQNQNFYPLQVKYVINNGLTSTGTATGIFLNATETALNGMTHNLMDLQKGGVSQFKVLNSGGIQAEGTSTIPTARMQFINDPTNAVSVFSFTNTTGATTFGGSIFRLNGTTNAFPAIKRNGAAIDFRLADDSGYANVRASTITCVATIASSYLEVAGNMVMTGNEIYAGSVSNTRISVAAGGINIQVNGSTLDASALFQLNSTTKGFRPPRMTTTEKNAISSPATGLVVFDTTLGKLCVYSGAWQTVTSV